MINCIKVHGQPTCLKSLMIVVTLVLDGQKRKLYRSFPQAVNTLPAQSHQRRRRGSSSDSSFLESADPKAIPNIITLSPRHLIAEERMESEESAVKVRYRSVHSDSEGSELSHHPKETFTKRLRYKTREDLYEPKKKENKKRSHREAADEPVRKRRKKKGDKGKAARKAGEDLMHNFSSKSIAQERLTVSLRGLELA